MQDNYFVRMSTHVSHHCQPTGLIMGKNCMFIVVALKVFLVEENYKVY